jgi:hypothetical protein
VEVHELDQMGKPRLVDVKSSENGTQQRSGEKVPRPFPKARVRRLRVEGNGVPGQQRSNPAAAVTMQGTAPRQLTLGTNAMSGAPKRKPVPVKPDSRRPSIMWADLISGDVPQTPTPKTPQQVAAQYYKRQALQNEDSFETLALRTGDGAADLARPEPVVARGMHPTTQLPPGFTSSRGLEASVREQADLERGTMKNVGKEVGQAHHPRLKFAIYSMIFLLVLGCIATALSLGLSKA